jgi:hypothetical protein
VWRTQLDRKAIRKKRAELVERQLLGPATQRRKRDPRGGAWRIDWEHLAALVENAKL